MAGPRREHLNDLQGAVRLALDGTRGVVDVVESVHGTIQRFTLPVGRPPAERTFGITGLVYEGVRGGIERVGGGIQAALDPWLGLLPEGAMPSAKRDAVLAVLNAVWGDHLFLSENPLALPMSVRPGDSDLPSRSEDRLLILAHGLGMSDGAWRTASGHDHGARLAAELRLRPLYLQYNSGLPIHRNGRSFAALIEVLCERWPRPIEEIILLGYSMGGLVARSAAHYAELEGYGWRSKLTRLVTLGTPHHGSPLERGGAWADCVLEASPYSAPIARLTRRRSAGIADLGHGTVTESGDPVPLPTGVHCYALAGSSDPEAPSVGAPRGDGLVPVASALGLHDNPSKSLAFSEDRQAIVYGISHLRLLGSEVVFTQMRDWLGSVSRG